MKLGKKKEKDNKPKNDDFLAQEAKENQESGFTYTLDIPEDEIWTYQIEGLQKPYIGQPYKNAGIKKVIIVIILIISIALSIFFSVQVVQNDPYKYNELEDGTYELVKFTNTGDAETGIKDVTIDYVVTDFETGEKDTSKKITKIHEYAFNCDEVINSVTLGKDVKEIDSKSFYSCWNLENIYIDDENENYCDLDGVVYNKDLTELIHYPVNHDKQLRREYGYDKLVDDQGNPMEELWGTTRTYNEAFYRQYNRDTRTYVIPSTVTKIGELALAYSNIIDLYIPEGVTVMENMAIFKNTVINNIFSYKTDGTIVDTTYKAIDSMSEIYASLPEGLEYIGSDCFYYLRGLSYMYIPSSVTTIKHHAFWDAVYKENDELKGITYLDCGMSEEDFEKNVTTGDQWRPQYDYRLFKKSIDVNYNAERKSTLKTNIHSNYYWTAQWVINNTNDTVKNNSKYQIKDMNNDGMPEMVLRLYDEEKKATEDIVYTIEYNYLTEYKGEAQYDDASFSELTDNAQFDKILA